MQELAALPPTAAATWLAEQPDWVVMDIAKGAWWWIGRPEQQAPPGDWFVWLLRSGRGFGKTRTAAEWLVDRALRFPADTSGYRTEWLLIAETLSDAMRQCVQGPAGIRRVLDRRVGPDGYKILKTPKPSIEILDGGQMIYIEGADDEDVGRGYNASGAWLDEYAKWSKPDGSWAEGIMPSLRADLPGDFPRAIVATTPKLVMQLVEWNRRTDGSVHVTTGSTYDNAANLAAPVIAELHRRYSGTRLGRQELLGELIEEIEGALWKLDWIEQDRVAAIPQLSLRVVAFDPAGSGGRDESGLVAAGRGANGHDYVLGDWSKQVAGHEAARRAWEMFNAYSGDWLVYEANMGKKWVTDLLVQAYKEMQKEGVFPTGGAPPMKAITAKIGKKLRAEPVAARYEQGGRVHHAGKFGDMETQMVSWVPEETADSPDRVDALVYALLFLFDRERLTMRSASPNLQPLQRTGLSPLA